MLHCNQSSFAACWPFVQPLVTTPLCNVCVKGVLVAVHTHPEGWSGRFCVIITPRNKNSSVPCYRTNFLFSTERNSLCWQFFTLSCETEELSSSFSSPLVGGEGRIPPSLMLASISSTKPQSNTVLLRVGFFVGGEARRERKEKESWHSKKQVRKQAINLVVSLLQ